MLDPRWADFINQHQAGIWGGFGTVATAGAFIVKQWWEDRREQRAFDAEEKTKDRLLNMVQQSLDDRKANEERTNDLNMRQVVVLENMAQSQRAMNGKLDKLLGLKTNGHLQSEA